MNPHITKALASLQNAHYAGYFEEMDKIVPAELRTPYNQHKGMFIANSYPFNFYQQLEVFAKDVDKELGKVKPPILNPETPKNQTKMGTPKATYQKPPAIFTAFANPKQDLENLNKEQKGIQKAFLDLDSKDLFKHITSIQTSLEDYFNFLQPYQNRIAIFHYGGHAGSTGITLQDGHLSFEYLAEELVNRNKDSLVLVFLNGCATKAHVKTLFELGVPLVLATEVPIKDDTATLFANKFYENLSKGDTILMAYQSASRFTKAKNSALNFTHLGQINRMSDVIQGVSVQNNAFPWGLYVRDETKKVEEMKLMSIVRTISDNTRGTLTYSETTSQHLKNLTQNAQTRFSRNCQRRLDFAQKKYDNIAEELAILEKSWLDEMDEVRKAQYARRIQNNEQKLNEIDVELQNIEKECQQ